MWFKPSILASISNHLHQLKDLSMKIFRIASPFLLAQLVVEEFYSCFPFAEQYPFDPSNCSLVFYFLPSDETLPIALCSIPLSGVLGVANLHLPWSFHPNYCPKSGTTSCDLSSWEAYLLHLPLLCVVIWWIDIGLLTGAQWPQVLGFFVVFAYCLSWHSFLLFLSNVFCFLWIKRLKSYFFTSSISLLIFYPTPMIVHFYVAWNPLSFCNCHQLLACFHLWLCLPVFCGNQGWMSSSQTPSQCYITTNLCTFLFPTICVKCQYALSSKRYGTPPDHNSCLRVISIILPAAGMPG